MKIQELLNYNSINESIEAKEEIAGKIFNFLNNALINFGNPELNQDQKNKIIKMFEGLILNISGNLPPKFKIARFGSENSDKDMFLVQIESSTSLFNFPISFYVSVTQDSMIMLDLHAGCFLQEKLINEDYISKTDAGSYDNAIIEAIYGSAGDSDFTLSGPTISAFNYRGFKIKFSEYDENIKSLFLTVSKMSDAFIDYAQIQGAIASKFSDWYIDTTADFGDIKLIKIKKGNLDTWMPNSLTFTSNYTNGDTIL